MVFTGSVLTSCATTHQDKDYDYVNKRWLTSTERATRDAFLEVESDGTLAIASANHKLCLANADKVEEQGKQLFDIAACHVDRVRFNEAAGLSELYGVDATEKQIVNMWVTSCHLGYKLSCARLAVYDRAVAENRQRQQAEQARRDQALFDAFSGVVKSVQPKPTTTTNCRPDYVGGYTCKTQ